MTTVTARHILIKDKKLCKTVKEQINSAEISFEEAAKKYSFCSTAVAGGKLGTFEQGQMVPEFDYVAFHYEVGKMHGPIPTQFGFHLIEILERE